MDYRQPHIRIESNFNGEVTIEIDDEELFDFIEDFLIEECSIEYAFCIGMNANGGVMHFKREHSFETLKRAIQRLDRGEVERIYNLNN